MLLFNDSIVTFVPNEDQKAVMEQQTVKELASSIEQPLRFISPRALNYNHDEALTKHWQELREKLTALNEVLLPKRFRKNENYGQSLFSQTKVALEDFISTSGWKRISGAKVEHHILQDAMNLGLAIRLDRLGQEQRYSMMQPVFVHPQLYGLFMTRHAVDFSAQTGMPSVSFDDDDIKFAMAHKSELNTSAIVRNMLLQQTVQLTVPENIKALRVGDYLEIRDGLKDVRKDLNELFQRLIIRENLDTLSSEKQIVRDINEFAIEIAKKADEYGNWYSRNTKGNLARFSFKAVVSTGVAAAAATTGPIGAIVSGCFSMLVDPTTDKLFPAMNSPFDNVAKTISIVHARVSKAENALISKRSRPLI